MRPTLRVRRPAIRYGEYKKFRYIRGAFLVTACNALAFWTTLVRLLLLQKACDSRADTVQLIWTWSNALHRLVAHILLPTPL
jgi:hypothetical protein